MTFDLRSLTRRGMLTAAAVVALFVTPLPAPAAVTAFKQSVAESSARNDDIAAFYRARSFAPLWTGEGADFLARRQALFQALDQASLHGLPANRYAAQELLARMSAVQHTRDLGALEVELSRVFLQFASDLKTGVVAPARVDSDIKRVRPEIDGAALLTQLADSDALQVIRGLAPQTPEYTRLLKEKLRFERVVATGGWGAPIRAAKLSPGDTGPAVVALRNRLVRMGYLRRTATASFDSALEAAVVQFQSDHGITPDGVAGEATLTSLNKSATNRLQAVIVAMERERWTNLPEGRGHRHVLVNLTDFKARIIDNGKVTFETRSVIGHRDADRRTPEFSDVMELMVINPSWHVPRSIIVKEYLPKLRNNSGAVGHLQIVDRRGRVVSRGQSFAEYSASSFPFSMRQPPGPRNALGLVKFLFPNKYNIYLHDTPSKNLFNREVRAFSHGCIRLADPQEFAHALLAKQQDKPVDYFQRRLRSGAETRVDLDEHVPVHLIYRTAYTTAKGRTQFRNDIYGRDAKVWRALAAAGVIIPAPGS